MRIKLSKKLSLFVMALGFSCVIMAQQEPQFSQYMFNRMSYNPGYAGSSGYMCATAMYRNQWMGFSLDPPTSGSDAGSTPEDILFTFDMPVKFLHGGIGFTFVRDMIGYHKNNWIAVDYAFRMFWGPGNLSVGIEADYLNSAFDFDPIPSEGTPDPILNGIAESANLIDGSVGLYYQVPGKYYVGLSVKNLLAAHSDEILFSNARTVYAIGGFDYTPAGAPSIRLKPSAMLKTADFSYFQAEVSCLLDYRNAFWGGLGYRVQDAIYVMAGVHWKGFRIGASYDLTVNKFGGFKPGRSMGSVELFLKFCFKHPKPIKPGTSYGNTIYLL